MKLSCLFGHDWKGCKCTRCGEVRDEGHIFRPVPGQCEERCAVCGKKRSLPHLWNGCRCERCGEIRNEYHSWDGCKCRRCGAVREQGHRWEVVPHDRVVDVKEKLAKMHRVHCSKCGRSAWEDHVFSIDGCRYTCIQCGYEAVRHVFQNGVCKNCGCSESGYYVDLIGSGKVGYFDSESRRGQINVRYGDRVTGMEDLTRLAIALSNNCRADNRAPKAILRRIEEAAAGDMQTMDRALERIASNDEVHIYWRRNAADMIRDKQVRARAEDSIMRWAQEHPISQMALDYENAMIAMDSGLGRS